MPTRRIIDALKELARIERYPFLKRYHGRGGALLVPSRETVARGVGIGFFFGILTPVAQIVFALLAAIVLRGNLVVAVGSTLITNPFTLPFVYYFAYRVGFYVTGRGRSLETEVAAAEQAAEHAYRVADWIPTLLEWVSSIGFPLVIGVVALATTVGLCGYLTVHAVWGLVSAARRLGRVAIDSLRR
jgi:hypothetical protein